MHNAWVTTSGEKMSKSLGNSLLVDEVVKRIAPVELRYYLVSAHYRSMLEYSDTSVAEAGQGYRRIEGFLRRSWEMIGDGRAVPEVDPALRLQGFDDAMDNDLAVPQALAVLHEEVRRGNAALTAQNITDVEGAFGATLAMIDVFGLNPWDPLWATGENAGTQATEVIDALVQVLMKQRQEARARKDFAAADAIRDGLDQIGIRIEDTAQGARWTLEK